MADRILRTTVLTTRPRRVDGVWLLPYSTTNGIEHLDARMEQRVCADVVSGQDARLATSNAHGFASRIWLRGRGIMVRRFVRAGRQLWVRSRGRH